MTKPLTLAAGIALAATAVHAEGTRDLGAHEHGAGALNIALEGTKVAMEFEAPGADIVGFEYAATSEEDRATIDTAISDLARPMTLFVMPAVAGCTVTAANVALIGEDEHDHDAHGHDEEHAHEDEHGHEHEDKAHASKDAHHHDEDHAHEEHAADEAEVEHTEFHADYTLDCAAPGKIDQIAFAYFERFPNALELEVQILTESGAKAFEVERDAPVLDLRGMF